MQQALTCDTLKQVAHGSYLPQADKLFKGVVAFANKRASRGNFIFYALLSEL